MIKAVIFDFDGLIVDTESVWYDAYKETMTSYNVDLPLQEFAKCIGTSDTVLFAYLEEQMGETCNKEEIEEKAKSIVLAKMTSPKAREGVHEYLEEARNSGYQIALASSSSKEWVTTYLRELGLIHFFDHIITRDDVERVKPAPDLYLRAIEALNIDATEAIAFEDSLNGLQAALAAGLKCVIVPNPVTEGLAFENHHARLTSMGEKRLSEVVSLLAVSEKL
ncbi:HAD family hydrolase [Bacillus sp. M6-12]|uniref:HAD family hydrolase n=1 Tax=Bacillus sp. M6-12 TaxID=2054166 RepID=UPI000C76D55E|nr:HAD family hydrolase [Bacillus sp. M6-12]PLS16464.1 HAD family hydrolase [Bacillus sp. M6-12]